MKINKQVVQNEILVGIQKYVEILNEHKGAVLERHNLDSLVRAYIAISNDGNQKDIDTNELKVDTLREVFNIIKKG